jgi:hypothetical protein
MKKGDFDELRVECKNCGKRFDFLDYLTSDDEDKHIAEIILDKFGGDDILCEKCKELGKRTIEKGKFELIGNETMADIKFETEDGKKVVWKFVSSDEGKVTFEPTRILEDMD